MTPPLPLLPGEETGDASPQGRAVPVPALQQIHVCKVLGGAEVNFTTYHNMVVHHPSLIVDLANLTLILIDLVLIGAIINTENFH